MPRHLIDVEIEPGLESSLRPAWVRRVVARTLERCGVRHRAEVGVLLTDDRQVRRLNRKYRGLDRTTDVLSFALEESTEHFPGGPDNAPSLGQVVVSYPRAVRQARRYGHSVQREVAFLVAHGTLHLLGYDHQRPAEEARMFAQQEAVLSSLGITRD
jgi:probable rRNA maturation factor